MYADSIIQRSIEKIEAAQSLALNRRFRLHRFPDDLALEMIEKLAKLRDSDGRFIRDITPTEAAFIENELTMSRIDWRYWATRYAYILSASKEGGKVLFRPAGSQELLLEKITELEIAMFDAYGAGLPVDGICLIQHKARQLGATMIAQLLLAHRTFFTPGYRALTASLDDQATQSVHTRFTRIYDNMPWWMAPEWTFKTKERGMRFGRLDSVMELQDGKQTKGLGQGEQWDGGHITECASWHQVGAGAQINKVGPGTIEHDFFPTIPFSIRALVLLESTAQGRVGWWFDFTEQVRSGTAEGGAGRFHYTFVPYYAIDAWDQANGIVRGDTDTTGLFEKYRRNPPPDWVPNEETARHAKVVEATSPEWMNGRTVVLDREVLYWYESTRQSYYQQGRLNSFFTNYCATPEESFQHAGNGAISIESIDRIASHARTFDPWPYALLTEAESRECPTYSDLPVHRLALSSGLSVFVGPMHPAEVDRDPRGVIWLWEQPLTNRAYYCGADPSGGIPGWNRAMRQKDDIKTDNGVVEVYRKELSARKAVQVAEFAAPVDAEDLAKWIWVLSKLFVGNCEMDECPTIVENNNTGLLTVRKLVGEYGHTNLYRTRAIDGEVPKFTNSLGWNSSPSTVPILHARSKGVIERGDVEIRSVWLAKELSDAIVQTYADGERARFHVPAGAGRHDDRMAASFFDWWQLWDWTEAPEEAQSRLPEAQLAGAMQNLAATDCTAEEQQSRWNEAVDRMFSGVDLDDPGSDDHYEVDEDVVGW